MLCKKLKLKMDDVLNVYRVCESAITKSDCNVIIVTKSGGYESRGSVDDIDAHIFSKEEWTLELKSHRFMCWLTLFLPQNAIWREQCNIAHIEDVEGFKFKEFVDALKR